MGQILIAWLAILFFLLAAWVGLVGTAFVLIAVLLGKVPKAGIVLSIALGLIGALIHVGIGKWMAYNAVGHAIWQSNYGLAAWIALGFFPICCLSLLVSLLSHKRVDTRHISV